MDMFDDLDKYPDGDVSQVAENRFQKYYLRPLGDNVSYVRLESTLRPMYQGHILMFFVAEMHMKDSSCECLVKETAIALNEHTVGLMFLAVQKNNLKLSVKSALGR